MQLRYLTQAVSLSDNHNADDTMPACWSSMLNAPLNAKDRRLASLPYATAVTQPPPAQMQKNKEPGYRASLNQLPNKRITAV
jgi:hypothetical protein